MNAHAIPCMPLHLLVSSLLPGEHTAAVSLPIDVYQVPWYDT